LGDSNGGTISARSKPYPEEFRRKIIVLYHSGRSASQLAREFEPCAQTIRGWVEQAEIDEGERDDGLTSDEKDELAKLRADNRKLREKREISKKAAAWFAQEANPTTNSGSSNS
jgi:transposase